MARRAARRRTAALVAIPLLVVVLLAVLLAGDSIAETVLDTAANPPWEADPTRITENLTPFSGIEGFEPPTPVPTRAP